MASAGKDKLSSYSVVKAIGKGSYGEVFLVRHSKERKQVSHQLARRQISNSAFLWTLLACSFSSSFPRSVCHEEHQADCSQCQGEVGCRTGGKGDMRGASYQLRSTCMSAPPPSSPSSLFPLPPPPSLTCAGISTVSATTPEHCLLQGVLSRPAG